MYITALSNYSKDLYPLNHPGSFINHLAEPIHLQSGINYEIALASFSYNANHYIQNELSFSVFDWKHQNIDDSWGVMVDLKIGHAIINNSEDLCTHLNSIIWSTIDRFKEERREFFTYGKNRRIWVNFDQDTYITIILNSALLLAIGACQKDKSKDVIIVGKTKPADSYQYNGQTRVFKDTRVLRSSAETRDYMRYVPDIGLSDEVIIYTDLVRSSHVGSSMANVLKFSILTRRMSKDNVDERRVIDWGSDRTYQDLICKDIYQVRFDIRSVHNEEVRLKDYVRLLIHIREKK